MAERELIFIKRPDRSLEANSGSSLRVSAERDFRRVAILAQSSPSNRGPIAGTLIAILKFQGLTDIDATLLRASIRDSLSAMNSGERSSMAYTLARAEIGLGNISAAEAALAAAGENRAAPQHVLRDFARGYAKAGFDPLPILNRAEETAGRVRIKKNPDVFEISTDKKITDLTDLAVVCFELGRDSVPFLTQAKELLGYSQAYQKYFEVGELVRAYAACGDFTNALALVDEITMSVPESTKEERTKARSAIAQEQLKIGDIRGALDTAEGSGDNILIGDINAKAAIYKAEQGADPAEEIAKTLSLMPEIEDNLAKGLLYSMLGRVKALIKEDPTPMFVMAMEKALGLTVYDSPMAELLNRLTGDVDASGFDATPVFSIALDWVDSAVVEEDIFPLDIYQGMATKAIIEQQIKLGYLEMAEQTLTKLEEEDWDYILLLANLAYAKATKAMAT